MIALIKSIHIATYTTSVFHLSDAFYPGKPRNVCLKLKILPNFFLIKTEDFIPLFLFSVLKGINPYLQKVRERKLKGD